MVKLKLACGLFMIVMGSTSVFANPEIPFYLLNGNVGLSVTSPSSRFHVKSSGGDVDQISLEHSGNFVKIASLGQLGSHGSLVLRENNAQIATLLRSDGNPSYFMKGRVGIGTATPADLLHVNGSARFRGQINVGYDPDDFNLGKLAFHPNHTKSGTQYFIGLLSSSSQMTVGGGTNLNLVFDSGNSVNYGNHIFRKKGWDGSKNVFSEAMRLTSLGRLGVGTADPVSRLHVKSTGSEADQISLQHSGTKINIASLGQLGNAGSLVLRNYNGQIVTALMADGTPSYFMNGNVGIGVSAPSQKLQLEGNGLINGRLAINAPVDSKYHLLVNGVVKVKEMIVEMDGWADFVFDSTYSLMPIEDVARFVKINRHLPGVPSEQELKQSGINTAKMQAVHMKKIEELTLYVIDLHAKNKVLEARIEALEKAVNR
jgi:hypothetical protein